MSSYGCPHCSFQPTSMDDFCDVHRPRQYPKRAMGCVSAALKRQPRRVDMGMGGQERFVAGSDVVVDRAAITKILDYVRYLENQ